MLVPPTETYSVAEAAAELRKSERQVHRYLKDGRLRGSNASGRWAVTAMQIWEFQGVGARPASSSPFAPSGRVQGPAKLNIVSKIVRRPVRRPHHMSRATRASSDMRL